MTRLRTLRWRPNLGMPRTVVRKFLGEHKEAPTIALAAILPEALSGEWIKAGRVRAGVTNPKSARKRAPGDGRVRAVSASDWPVHSASLG